MMSPENAAVVQARYNFDLGSSGINAYVEAISSYTSKRYLDLGNRAYLPSRWTTDIFTGVSGEHWDATIYLINAFDADEIASGVSNVDYGLLPDSQSVPSGNNLVLPQPRTLGLRASYRVYGVDYCE